MIGRGSKVSSSVPFPRFPQRLYSYIFRPGRGRFPSHPKRPPHDSRNLTDTDITLRSRRPRCSAVPPPLPPLPRRRADLLPPHTRRARSTHPSPSSLTRQLRQRRRPRHLKLSPKLTEPRRYPNTRMRNTSTRPPSRLVLLARGCTS